MGEWLKPAVLKTVSGVTRSGVRIPLPPPRYFCADVTGAEFSFVSSSWYFAS